MYDEPDDDVSVELVPYSVERIYEALSKSGFEHIRSQWFDVDIDGAIVGGCILQQGALNLSVWASDNDVDGAAAPSGKTLYNVLDTLPNISKKWATQGGFRTGGCGDAIVYWNDRRLSDDLNWSGSMDEDGYVLPTYHDVLVMAKEILEPYFGKTVELEKKVWQMRRNPDLIFQGASA